MHSRQFKGKKSKKYSFNELFIDNREENSIRFSNENHKLDQHIHSMYLKPLNEQEFLNVLGSTKMIFSFDFSGLKSFP